MSDRYFTADLHLGYKHTTKARGFSTVHEHDRAIIASFERCPKRSKLWVLGDIAKTPEHLALIAEIPCKYKVAVLGNHDTLPMTEYLKVFDEVRGLIQYKGYWLSHCPVHPQELNRTPNGCIHGHIHKGGASPQLAAPYFNVNWDFYGGPISFEEVDFIREHEEIHKIFKLAGAQKPYSLWF